MSEEETPEVLGHESEGFVDVLEAERDLLQARAQLESLLNATDSLEALITHLDTTDIVSKAHKQAVVVSFENLIGESGISVNDLLPSLEGHEAGTVSTESLKDKMKGLWTHLVNAILQILAFVREFWNRIKSFRGRLRMTAEHLAKHAGARRHITVRNPNVELGMEIKSLIVGNSVVNDPDALIRSISAAMDQYKIVTTHYGAGMIDIGQRFERLLQSGKSGQDMLSETCQLFTQMPLDKIASQVKAMVYRDPRFGRRLTMAAPPIIGGWTLYFLTLEQAQRDLASVDPLNFAAALRTTGIKFALTSVNRSNVLTGTVKTASGQQVEHLARRVIDILDLIEQQERVMKLSRVEQQIKNVLRAGEQYQNRSSEVSDSYDLSVLRFVRNYAAWAVGPVDQLTTNLLTVSRSLLTYGRKSLSNT
jgi:hypothetical protein